jgi:hypothetical protein
MKILTIQYGTFELPDDATHLHGLPIQTLVDHLGATLDYVRFVPGQRVRWTIGGSSAVVEIIKQSDALPGYWLVTSRAGLAVMAHESDLTAIEPELAEVTA